MEGADPTADTFITLLYLIIDGRPQPSQLLYQFTRLFLSKTTIPSIGLFVDEQFIIIELVTLSQFKKYELAQELVILHHCREPVTATE
jgi:hypothetical protein